MQQGGIDLVLLDVQMATLTGLQFFQLLKGQCLIILTTAYAQYALESYEYAVADYLLKPISLERFFKAVQRVHASRPALTSEAPPLPATTDYLFLKTDNRLLKISYADIYYIEGARSMPR